jgi:dTDP-4-amino-4,6-dideoxygalactose transaminase
VVPETDRVAERLLTLPLHPLMTRQDVETVCEALMESL